MKKIPVLCFVFIMLCSLCVPASAAQSTVKKTGVEYAASEPSPLPSQGGREVQLWAMNYAAYDLNLKYPATEMELDLRTGVGYRGTIAIYLGSTSGTLLAKIDTNKLSGEWTKTTATVSFSEAVSGSIRLLIYCENGCHWIDSFSLNQLSPDAAIRHFVSPKTEDAFLDIADDANVSRINLLADLGIIPKTSGQFLPSRTMTRIEFVGMVGRAVNAEQYANGSMPFADVPADSEYASVLNGLYTLGVIRGDTDGNFRPNSFITANEAASVCCNALGYRFTEGSTKNAYSCATQLKLFRGVTTQDGYLTKSGGARMMYNLATCEYLKATEISEGKVVYEPEKNFLEKSAHYYTGKGVVTSNYDTGLYSTKSSGNVVTIGDEKFIVKDTLADAYLGVLCEYFYTGENDEVKTLVAIRPAAGVNVISVRSEIDVEFEKITEQELVYTVADEEYEYSFDASTAFIYNGVALDTALSGLVNASDFMGTITLVDNNKDEIYDCVLIDSAKTVVVDGIRDGVIKDKLTGALLDTEKATFDLYVGGKTQKTETLEVGAVLTVYESVNKTGDKLIRAIADPMIVSGTITEFSGDEIVIDGEAYEKDSACKDDLYIGLEADFYLNEYGKLVKYQKNGEGKVNIGIFLGADKGGNGLVSQVKVKLLTQDGVQIFDAAERVTADGVKLKTQEKLYQGEASFSGLKLLSTESPVRYQLNSNNQLKMIDTINSGVGGDNDTLKKLGNPIKSYGAHNVLIDSGTWNTAVPYSKDVIFITLTEDKNEKNYRISNGFPHVSDTNMTWVTPYATGEDSFIADILVAESYGSGDSSSWKKPFIFESVSQRLDSEGDSVMCVNGYASEGKVSYDVDMDKYAKSAEMQEVIRSAKPGDILWPKIISSKIYDLSLIYLYGGLDSNAEGLVPEMKAPNYETPSTRGGPNLYQATVVAIEDGFVKLLPDATVAAGEETYQYHTLSNLVVASCEKTASGDVKVSCAQPSSSVFVGDKVLFYTENYTITGAFIYRKIS